MKSTSRTVPAPLRHSIAVLLVFAAAAHAKAATYTWDGDPLTAGAQDGGGVWNPTNTNWISAGSNTIWNNANDAVFGAGVDGSYAVSVVLNPTAVSLIFNNSGYTLSATGAQTITVTNSSNTTNGAINLVTGKTATIGSGVTVTTAILNQNSAITGAGTLIIENGGTVRNGGTANTNVLNINSATVEVRTGGSLLTAPVAAGNGNAIFVNGNLNVVGGTVNAVGTLGIGQSAAAGTTAGTLTITNGTVAATSTNGVRFGAASGTTPGGTLNLNGGTLTAAIIFKGAVGTTNAVVNLNGGTLQASAASATFFQGLTRANVRNGGAIIDTNGRNITIGQALEHSNIAGDNATDGGLIKRGAGTLILNGANTYNGGTTVNAGTLQFNAGAFPLGLVTINSAGVLNATGAHATVPEWLGIGNVAPSSTGAIALVGDSADDINFAGYANLMLGASTNSFYSGTLTPSGNTYRLGGGGATLNVINPLTGANNLVVGAAGSTGTVSLFSDNDYTGSTTINSGTLQFQGASIPTGLVTIGSAGALAVPSVASWLTLGNVATSSAGVIAQAGDNAEDINLGAYPNLILGAFNNSNYSGTLTPSGTNYRLGGGGGTLTLINVNALTGANNLIVGSTGSTGTVVLASDNDYTGSTTINSGTLQLGNGITDGSIAATSSIVNNGTLAFNPAISQTFSQTISGTGGLTKLGTGTLILSGTNAFSGVTTLSNGVLQLANSAALGSSTISTIVGSAQLQLAGDITVTNSIRLQGPGLNGDGMLRSVSGTNTVTDFGILNTGGTRIGVAQDSTLNLPNSIALGIGGGAQNFRVVGTGTVFLGGNNSAAIGAANLFLLGTGTSAGPIVKVGHNAAFGLGTIDFQPVAAATVQSSDTTARTIANAVRFSDTALNQATLGAAGTGDLTFTGAVTLLGSLAVTVSNASTTFTGAINGALFSLTKAGDGTLKLNGAQNYDTLTTSAGTTNLNAALGSGASTLNADAATNVSVSQKLAALNIGAGGTVTLTAQAPAAFPGADEAVAPLDGNGDVGVSAQAVPEPNTISAFLVGLGTLLGLRRRRTRATAC